MGGFVQTDGKMYNCTQKKTILTGFLDSHESSHGTSHGDSHGDRRLGIDVWNLRIE